MISEVETLVHDDGCSRRSGSETSMTSGALPHNEAWFFSPCRGRINPRTAQLLFDPLRRPAERNQFVPRMTRRWVERQRSKVGASRVVYPSLDLQGMPELQIRIGGVGVYVDRFSIGRLRLRHVPGFLQGMAILNPHFRRVWHVGERLPVMPGGEFPSARLLGAFGPQDLRTDAARVKPGNPVAPIATNPGEDRAYNFAGQKEAPPRGFERVRTDAGRVEAGRGPAPPQRLINRIIGENRPLRRLGQLGGLQRLPPDPPLPLAGGVPSPRSCRETEIASKSSNQPITIRMGADEPKLRQRPVQRRVLLLVGHRH